MNWETHRGRYTSAGTVDANKRNWGAGRNLEKAGVGQCQTLTQIVPGLDGKLGCVQSCELVKNDGQLLCKVLSSSDWLAPRVI